MAALLAAGSDFNTLDYTGETPLKAAEGYGHIEVRLAPDTSRNKRCKLYNQPISSFAVGPRAQRKPVPNLQVCTVHLVEAHMHLMFTVQKALDQQLYAAA